MSSARPGFFEELFSKFTLAVIGLTCAQFVLGVVLLFLLPSGDYPNLTGPAVSFLAVVELLLYMSVAAVAVFYRRRVSERFLT